MSGRIARFFHMSDEKNNRIMFKKVASMKRIAEKKYL